MSNTVSQLISDEQLNRIVQIESAGNPNAKAGTSSAAGLGQFITGTWLDTVRRHRPDIARANTRDQLIAMRVGTKTAPLQLEMLACFTEDNARALGAGFTDGDLYLAHFLGLGDARNLFRAPPDDPAPSHVTAAAVKANRSILAGKTCAEVRAWAQSSMEGRWNRAGRPDWVKKYHLAPAAAPVIAPVDKAQDAKAAVPVTPIALPAPVASPKKSDGWAAAILAAIVAAAGTAYEWAMENLPEIFLAVVAAIVLATIFFRWRKGHWPWTSLHFPGVQLPALLPRPLPSSAAYSAPALLAHLEALRDLSPARPSPRRSVSRQRRKLSAKPSPRIRKRPNASRSSKPSTRTRSSSKRKSRSRG
jgi:hypothetical protein